MWYTVPRTVQKKEKKRGGCLLYAQRSRSLVKEKLPFVVELFQHIFNKHFITVNPAWSRLPCLPTVGPIEKKAIQIDNELVSAQKNKVNSSHPQEEE
jgi:hypothetical protein